MPPGRTASRRSDTAINFFAPALSAIIDQPFENHDDDQGRERPGAPSRHSSPSNLPLRHCPVSNPSYLLRGTVSERGCDDQLLIGSNGGPTAYSFVRGDYISIPFVFAGDWLNEVRVLGRSFEAFIEAIEHGDGW